MEDRGVPQHAGTAARTAALNNQLGVANPTERRIYRLCALCAGATALAVFLPRVVPNQEGGLASAATAILLFLVLLAGAAGLSLYLLVVTVRTYRSIALSARLAGIGPSVLLVTALAVLFGMLRY
jgi:hypothetical protein